MKEEIAKTMDAVIASPSKDTANALYEQIMLVVDAKPDEVLKHLAELTCLGSAIEQAIKTTRDNYAVAYMEKGAEKTIKAFGAEFTLKEAGVKYDYSDDDTWQMLAQIRDFAVSKVKEHEKVLLAKGRYVKTSTTSVSVKLP